MIWPIPCVHVAGDKGAVVPVALYASALTFIPAFIACVFLVALGAITLLDRVRH